MIITLKQAAQQALEALEEIALAGMSGTGQESEEGMRDWHARQAWKFIGIAARALDPLRTAIQQAEAKTDEPVFFVSPAQARAVNGKNRFHYTPSDNSGRYLPVRATPAGLFTQPVYTHPAPGVPDDVVRDAERYQWLRKWKGQEHEPPFTVQHEFDGTIWGGDLDSAIDAAMLTSAQAQKGQP